jgi:hypothetical protein
VVTQDELEALYGPAASYSEHKVGDRLHYTHEGTPTVGTILWVCAPRPEQDMHLVYVVLNDERRYPDFVFPASVLS